MPVHRQLYGVLGLEARDGKASMFQAIQEQVYILYKEKCQPVHEALHQRITVHYNFTWLDDSEVAQYIPHKVTCAGGAQAIIDIAALSTVHSHSSGNTRLIDNLMTDALTLGSQMDKHTIDAEVILTAVAGQNLM